MDWGFTLTLMAMPLMAIIGTYLVMGVILSTSAFLVWIDDKTNDSFANIVRWIILVIFWVVFSFFVGYFINK